MEVNKANKTNLLVKLDDLKSGDLFEHDNHLYIKTNLKEDADFMYTAVCICIELSTGTAEAFKFDKEVIKAKQVSPLNFSLDI